MTRVVVIGGIAAGMSAASQAKRRDPDLEVVVLERSPHVSYGACGMPYNIAASERAMEDLVVLSAERLREERGIDVRTRHEVLGFDVAARQLLVHDVDASASHTMGFDRLVVATGARAARPKIPGMDLIGVFVLRELQDGLRLKHWLVEQCPRRAVILGGGYVGLEMAEALRARGLDVVVLERLDQLAPGYTPALATVARDALVRHGVTVETSATVRAIERSGRTLSVLSDRGTFAADLVLVSVGVRPNVELAAKAGLRIGDTGAIAVDAHLRTSAPDVYAAGDCAEAYHHVSGRPVYVPLGTTANKQGKIAGANAAGADERFEGILGTSGFKVFDRELARTGLSLIEAQRLGLDAVEVASTHRSRGHAYPGSKALQTSVVLERGTGRVLGAQMAGAEAVALRIDVWAAALWNGMTAAGVEALDLAYAPPFAPVYDPVLIAAGVARKAARNVDGGTEG